MLQRLLHHAEIDRNWAIWASGHAGQALTLSGATAILDPWNDIYKDVLGTKVGDYAYSYDRMTF